MMSFITQNQKGAMFGLDARISMLIFGILSGIAGVGITMTTKDVTAGALTEELNQYAKAIEGIHKDLKLDLHTALNSTGTGAADQDAIIALYDNSVLTNSARWLGPYVRTHKTKHSQYGEMLLSKKKADHTVDCDATDLCYIWLQIADVPIGVTLDINENFDGDGEATPETLGRLQYSGAGDPVTVWFRIAKALNRN